MVFVVQSVSESDAMVELQIVRNAHMRDHNGAAEVKKGNNQTEKVRIGSALHSCTLYNQVFQLRLNFRQPAVFFAAGEGKIDVFFFCHEYGK